MYTIPPSSPLIVPAFPRLARRRSRGGIALVIVLGFLVLISALMVAFFLSVQTELTSAKSYAANATAKQLADTATNLVLGQISDATKTFEISPDPSTNAPGSGRRLTWASQPGAIHTWGDDGKPVNTFKLYSALNMVEVGPTEYQPSKVLTTEVPATWVNSPAVYVDINSPVLVPDQWSSSGAGVFTGLDGVTKYVASYPIVDPNSTAEGFTIVGTPGYTANSARPTDRPSYNLAAMPVVWLYVLQNGTITAPDPVVGGVGTTATFKSAPLAAQPSKDNPIVGRIAFWTDDESSKINVNTASEPTPWDMPRALTKKDLDYGRYQPANGEFQRYPGHPATVALSPVLYPSPKPPGYTPGGSIVWSPGVITPAQKDAIYSIVPRVQTGGTNSATVAVNNVAGNVVALDYDRLFASMDEFLFNTNFLNGARVLQPTIPTPSATNPPNKMSLDSKSLFFLTANSRSPELNVFGLPRVTMWPLNTDVNKRTVYDKFADFCATLGDTSPTAPANAKFGFSFQRSDSTSMTFDWTGIPRNQTLYQYLQDLTAKNVPGYGSSFVTKLGDDRDQVLTEIFDYIRSTNLRDPLWNSNVSNNFADGGQVTPIRITKSGKETQGFGRFNSISQVGMHFICGAVGGNEANGAGKGAIAAKYPTNVPANLKLAAGEKLVEAAFLIEPYSPSMGFYKLTEKMSFDVQFQGNWTLDGKPLNMTGGNKNLNNNLGSGWHNDGRNHGGPGGIRGSIAGFGAGGYLYVSTSMDTQVDDPTKRIKINASSTTMSFSGGTVVINVYPGLDVNPSSGIPAVQTFTLNIPSSTIAVPDLVEDATTAYDGSGATQPNQWWSIKARYGPVGACPYTPGPEYLDPTRQWADRNGGSGGFKQGSVIRAEDVVRSYVPDHGDVRLVAATPRPGTTDTTNASKFVQVRTDAMWQSYKLVHLFCNISGPHFIFGFGNEPTQSGTTPVVKPNVVPGATYQDQLVVAPAGSADVKYHYSKLPEIRPGAGKIFNLWGDFDNGPAQWIDGAYINKPDEGDQHKTGRIDGQASPYAYWAWNTWDGGGDLTDALFAANRMIPSSGMLGSLPTGVKRNKPWQTILFRPQTGAATTGAAHPGDTSPKDHLLMDLFWMPVIEPYAISEPFSTAGKVNLNYEIAPFTYIRRTTAIRAALKGEEPMWYPNTLSRYYKIWDHETNVPEIAINDASQNKDATLVQEWNKIYAGDTPPYSKIRSAIDPDQTCLGMDQKFSGTGAPSGMVQGIFRSASAVSEIHLVREGEKLTDHQSGKIWKDNMITGDNTRERPYTNLYGKVTTKSNSFTVHMRVQVLRKRATNDQASWIEGQDQVVSEYRGSALIERYIDANAKLPDFALPANSSTGSLDDYYKFRVISTKKFNP